MKFPKLFKRAAAVLMAAVTTLSVLPATTAFAAGDIGTISFTHTYDRNGNAIRYNSSDVFDGYTAGGAGKYHYRMYVDGDTAFCIQPGVPLRTGNTLQKNSSETWNALSANQKKAVGLALLYGYQGNRGSLPGSDDEKWLATQALVWEFVTGCRESTGSYQQTSQKIYNVNFGSNYPNSGAVEVYNQIVSLMSRHNTIPSFMSGGANDITKELSYQDGKYTLTLTDNNGVLSEYSFASSDSKVSVAKSGNSIKNGKGVVFKFPPALSSTHTALVLKEPKTKTSVRKVFLPKTVAEMLQKRFEEIENLKELFGEEYTDYNLVFASSCGRPIEGQVINRALKKLIDDNDLPPVVFHSFRHSSITYKLKLNGGDMKSVQGDSGHAQVKMVADVYSHIIDDDRRLNAQRFEEQFYQGKSQTPTEKVQAETVPEASQSDKEMLLKLLANPEIAAILKSLAKNL